MRQRMQSFRGNATLGEPAVTIGFIAACLFVGGSIPAIAQAEDIGDPFTGPSAAGLKFLQERIGVTPAPTLEQKEPAEAPEVEALVVPAPGAVDVIANDPADDTPERTTQSETALAVRGNTICAGYNNSGPGALSGLSRSTDLGVIVTGRISAGLASAAIP